MDVKKAVELVASWVYGSVVPLVVRKVVGLVDRRVYGSVELTAATSEKMLAVQLVLCSARTLAE